MELKEILKEIKKQEEDLEWEGTFADYFEMAVRNPGIARLAQGRIHDAIINSGITLDRFGRSQYTLFSGELFGIEKTISQIEEYFEAASRRLDTRKRILLLMGPPASGKSTIANLLKHGLEMYTRTDEGATYAIKGCPMQEEPLHLIPSEFREDLLQKYGLYIEGDLCPHCRWMLKATYHGNIDQIPVRRIILSEQRGIGIGTFVATDPGSQDLTRLTGGIDPEAIGEDRIESFGKAYRLNGELNVANRGIMEFIEMFKLDERFLSVLLVLTEEQKIKAPGYGTIYADEAIIAHSNETEYENMVRDKKTEGLQDRIVVINVPYNLRVHEEVQIYQKLLANVDLKGTHISPLSLPVAAVFAILSRLEPPERMGMSLTKKMRLYDGQFVEGFTTQDVQKMQEQYPREGFIGISPRYVINQISRAVSQSDVHCLDPIDLLQMLWDGLEQSTTLAHEESKRLSDLLQATREEYDVMAERELQKAFVENFDQAAGSLVQEYIQYVQEYLEYPDKKNGQHSQDVEPNERFMRSLERVINIQDYDKVGFRREIHARVEPLRKAGMKVDYRFDSRLEEAVLRKLCPNVREMGQILHRRQELNASQLAKRDEVYQRLIRERGFESQCALSLMNHVASVLNVSERPKTNLPRAFRWLQG
jgi:serine protein kinase